MRDWEQSSIMMVRKARIRRRGGSLMETLVTTTVLLMLMLGLVDMGVAVTRMHMISEAARQGTRVAICQGSLAPSALHGGPWGATAFSGTGTSTDPKVTAIKPYMSGLELSNVTVNVTWPDNSNAAEKRVTYQVSTTWKPLIGWIFGKSTVHMTAESTMLIAH
jgi:Flp pilus assembly protein TadG